MFDTLLYVSRSTLFMPDDERVVEEIVEGARGRNTALGITGALIFTHRHFAQYVEGPEVGIAELMASLRRDPRHCDMDIVSHSRSQRRRFDDWSMAYAGPSVFVEQQVEAALGSGLEDATSLSAERLIRLMAEFAHHQPLSARAA